MDPSATNMYEVLFLAALAFLFGGLWQWTGWLGWPTEPARRPLGKMGKADAPVAVMVYLGSAVLVFIVASVYVHFRDRAGVPETATAPSATTLPSATTAPAKPFLSTMEMFVLHLVSSIPVVAYFLARCFPRPDDVNGQTGLETKGFGRLALIGVVAGVTVMPLILLLNEGLIEAAYRLFDVAKPTDGHELLSLLRSEPTTMNYTLVCLMAVVVAPVAEELLFRGVIQSGLRELGRGPAVFISALMFMLVHVSSVGWQILPALALLGVVLSILFERTGVLWPGIIAHATFNACNVGLMFLQLKAGK